MQWQNYGCIFKINLQTYGPGGLIVLKADYDLDLYVGFGGDKHPFVVNR